MTTSQINITDQYKLLEDILQILFDTTVGHIEHGNKKILFTAQTMNQEVRQRFAMTWNNKLDFHVWRITKGGSVVQFDVPTSQWFRVDRLLRQRHIAAEKLKV